MVVVPRDTVNDSGANDRSQYGCDRGTGTAEVPELPEIDDKAIDGVLKYWDVSKETEVLESSALAHERRT